MKKELINNLLEYCKYPHINDKLKEVLIENEFIISIATFLDKNSVISNKQRSRVNKTSYFIDTEVNREWFKSNKIIAINLSNDGCIEFITKESHLKHKLIELQDRRANAENELQEIKLNIEKIQQEIKKVQGE